MGADDAAVGYEQARLLRATMAAAGIDRAQLWLYYFGIGGDVSEFEVDAYRHHSLVLPRLQRDLLAHAANEMLADIAPPRAPLAVDVLRDGDTSTGRHSSEEGASAGRHGSEQHASSAGDSDVMDRDEPEATDD